MACFHPLKGWRSRTRNENGKQVIVFKKEHGWEDQPVELPCGQCVGCRLERSRQWAIRCVHEASLYEHNCFLTLTYNDENLPEHGKLRLRDFQLFMKRLRKKYPDKKISFFHCGEYGDDNNRPHYHACIFNHDFNDKELYRIYNENPLYTSETLQGLWHHQGFCLIGDVTFESAAYVARYIMKKVTGDLAQYHYAKLDTETGEIIDMPPEYTTMSRNPGIGKGWYEKYKTDCFPSDFIVMNGKKLRIPKFYDTLHEKSEPAQFLKTKGKRKIAASKHNDDQTLARLQVREICQTKQADKLIRTI